MKLVGSKSAIRSPEFHKQKVLLRWLKTVAIVVIVAVLAVGPIMFLRDKHFRIAEVQIVGNEVTQNEGLEAITASDLSGNYLRVIPRDSALFYPRREIERDILECIPRLASVEVSLTSLHSLKISVLERQPRALYCQKVNTEKCFFLDEMGYIFAEAPKFSADVYLTIATEPALETPIRTQLFQPEEFKSLQAFINNLKTLGIGPEVLTRSGDEYNLEQEFGPFLKWKRSQDLDTLFVNLESFLHNSGLKVGEISVLEYIDLRFDNKVFYK